MSPVMDWAARRKIASEATGGFTPLEPNTYSFIIKDLPEVTEKDGWPRFKINPAVEAGPRANARVFHTFYTTEKPNGMKMFYDQMAVLGITEDWLDTVTDDKQIAQAMVGKRFTAELYHEMYQDKLQQRLRKIAAPVGSPVGPGAGPAVAAGGPAPVAAAGPNPFAAPAVQAAPAQQYAQAAPPVQQQAPAQQYAPQPVAQAAPAQQFAPPAGDNPWATTAGVPAPPFQ